MILMAPALRTHAPIFSDEAMQAELRDRGIEISKVMAERGRINDHPLACSVESTEGVVIGTQRTRSEAVHNSLLKPDLQAVQSIVIGLIPSRFLGSTE